ncbi:MAG: PBP1A family penicillin-binding protein [Alphaproteobacteria bacterium]|nr:PBP1A family penicillin-binding protein [Alphaproteobacteria bacterium]
MKWAFVAGLWAGIFIFTICAWYARELPDITRNATFERKASITVKAADGTVIGRYGEQKGENVRPEDLSPYLVYAVLATEDRRFYYHFGVDFIGLARAMAVNAIKGRFVQGGSTITQQLAKNLFLSQERTIKRKIQEAMLALWLEHQLTKDEILSAYLNRVYMGSGVYGIDAASRLYFNKEAKDINLEEAAALAGLLKAPSRYSPLANPAASKARAQTVLKAMVDAGYIEQSEIDAINNAPPLPAKKPVVGDSARYYADWVVDTLDELIGTPQDDIIVETVLDTTIQKAAEESLKKTIAEYGKEKDISQGAVIVMRPNGAVLAMVGGVDYATGQFNRAVQARRQPGSSFKPFVYLTAIERGWSPHDMILDEPFTEGKYRPQNYDGLYRGQVTLEEALMLSLNTAAVRLISALGPESVVFTARRLGITSPLEENLSLALGTASLAPLEMVTAYAAIANGGVEVNPYTITKITSEKGELYYERPKQRFTSRMFASQDTDTLTAMLHSVVEYGTGQRAKLPWPAYGKTGTSQESRDAWFLGFTNELVAGVWMGNDDISPMKRVTGGSFPAGVWRDVMMQSRGRYASVHYANVAEGFGSLMNRLVGPSFSQPEQENQQDRGIVSGFRPNPQTEREARRYND